MENLSTHNKEEGFIPEFAGNLQSGSSGDGVKNFQKKLKQLGYYSGEIDGLYGPITKTSVKNFQNDYELASDGIIGPVTKAKMETVISSASSFQSRGVHPEIKTLQRQLMLLGLYSGKIDGIFGPNTESGIKSFQQSSGLDVDGIAGPLTKAALKKKLLDGQTDTQGIPSTGHNTHGSYELGKLSAKYESNGDPGTISTGKGDRGGKSYGAWQFASMVGGLDPFLKWLAGRNKDYYDKLMNSKKQDGGEFGKNFDNTWKNIAGGDRSGFLKLQHDYVKSIYFDHAAASLKSSTGFDITARSAALKDVLWSTSVQHGAEGAVSIFRHANLNGSDVDIINAVYDERSNVEVHFRNSPTLWNGLRQRFENERKDALAMLDNHSQVLH